MSREPKRIKSHNLFQVCKVGLLVIREMFRSWIRVERLVLANFVSAAGSRLTGEF